MITTTEKSKYVLPYVGLLLSEDEASAKMNPLKIFSYQRLLPEKQSKTGHAQKAQPSTAEYYSIHLVEGFSIPFAKVGFLKKLNGMFTAVATYSFVASYFTDKL